MDQCPKFIRLFSKEKQQEISSSLCKILVGYSVDIFEKQLPSIFDGEDGEKEEDDDNHDDNDKGAQSLVVAWYIELLNHFSLTPKTRELFIKRKFKDIFYLL
jgi:hypothetical protein